jgi:hypothetical protein
VAGGGESACHHPEFTDFARSCEPLSANCRSAGNCHLFY